MASSALDVVVIGGGIAGLTAAVALSDRGLSVAVLERDARLAGRAQSWDDPTTGEPVHIGPHIFLDEYPNTWKLLDLLGTRDHITWQPAGHFLWMVDGQKQLEIRDAGFPPPAHYLPSLMALDEISTVDVLSCWAVTSLAMSLDEATVRALDDEDAVSFLLRMGVTQKFIDWYWRFTGLAILNVPLELCSAGALMRFYAFQVCRTGIKVGMASRGLGDLFSPARERIEASTGTVRLQTTVEKIGLHGDGVQGVELVGGEVIRARHVVAAVPPGALDTLLPDSLRTAAFSYLDRFEPVPYLSVYLWFDRRLTDLRFWARVHNEADLNCDFYDLSNIGEPWGAFGAEGRGSVICSNIIYSHRAEGLSDEEVVATTLAELAEFLPEAREATLVHSLVSRIPMAIHAPHPGTERLRPPVRTPVDGLVLAGDWIDTGFPSSMEGAVRAGWLAAEAVLDDLGRPEALSVAHRGPQGLAALYARLPRELTALGPQLAIRGLAKLRPALRR